MDFPTARPIVVEEVSKGNIAIGDDAPRPRREAIVDCYSTRDTCRPTDRFQHRLPKSAGGGAATGCGESATRCTRKKSAGSRGAVPR